MDPSQSRDASDEDQDDQEEGPKPPPVKKRKSEKEGTVSRGESTDSSYHPPDEEAEVIEMTSESDTNVEDEPELVNLDETTSETDDVMILDTDGLFSSDTDGITATNTMYKIRGLIYGSGGGTNTCTVDGFLTAIKIWFLRTKYDFRQNFKFTPPDGGYQVENLLRRLCHRVKVTNQDRKEIEPFELETVELQKIWMEFELGPDHGRLPNEVGKTEDKVFFHIRECALFRVTPTCDCPFPHAENNKNFAFMRNQAEVMNFCHYGLFPGTKIDPANPICRHCGTQFSNDVAIPPTTWIMRFKLNWNADITDVFPDVIRLDGVIFRHALTIYQETFPAAAAAAAAAAKRKSASASSQPPLANRDNPSLIVTGHETAMLTVKQQFYEYNDGQFNGLLQLRRIRQLKTSTMKKPVEVIYFRQPPLRIVQ